MLVGMALRRWRCQLVACALMLLATTRSAAGLDAIVPDAPIQAAIASIPAAKNAAQLDGALAQLQASSGGDSDRLVPQLLYFSMRGADVRAGMTAGVVIDRLQISKDQLLHAIVPYLDTSEPDLQRQLRNLLGAIDETRDDQAPDFSRYAPVLRQRSADPPLVLVTHMLATAPDSAFETLVGALIGDATARHSLLRAARTTDETALGKLARNKTWWVRLYVIARLQREPSLRTPALLRGLRDDAHPAVRAAARDLAQSP